ncbi:MAG TPA: hypothetical protein VGI75_07495, partial [Pirellulales bacterium]
MFATLLERIHRIISHPQWAWIGLWVGLAFFIVALVVMIRTSWGQSHPLRKCAGLSLLVHLLLAGYATTVQIVSATGMPHRGGMNLLLVDGSDDGSDQGIDDPAAPADGTPGNNSAMVTANYPNSSVSGAVEMASKPMVAPPLLELPPAKVPEAAPEVADAKPDVTPPEKPIVDAPKVQQDNAQEPIPPSPSPPPTNLVADDKSAEKATEPLPAMSDASPIAKIPDPPSTSQVGDWKSGAPSSGNLPAQPAPEGPTVAATAPTAAEDKNHLASTAVGTSAPVVSGPVVETGNPAVADRAVPEIYSDRVSPDRGDIVRRRGGSAEGESAVQAALHWLAANQSSDGRWNADKFGAMQEMAVPGKERIGAGGNGSKADTAVTGLALLAFLGAGNTHLH